MIHVKVKLFAVAKDIAGCDEITLALAPGSTVASVMEMLVERLPRFAQWQGHLRFAVNYEYVPTEHALAENDEVAVIPPVSGG